MQVSRPPPQVPKSTGTMMRRNVELGAVRGNPVSSLRRKRSQFAAADRKRVLDRPLRANGERGTPYARGWTASGHWGRKSGRLLRKVPGCRAQFDAGPRCGFGVADERPEAMI